MLLPPLCQEQLVAIVVDKASNSLDDIHSVLAMYLYAVWRDGNRGEVIK